MTDTTDQQAVTVAQEDREAAQIIANLGPDILRGIYREDFARLLARHRLASVSSASAEGSVREAFSGVMRGEVVNGGAWSLHLHFGRGDGARDRMRVASSLLGSIVTAPPTSSATTSQEGEWVTVPREPTQDQLIAGNGMFHTGEVPLNIYRAMLAASPEPVPATNQAGEVERLRADILKLHELDGSSTCEECGAPLFDSDETDTDEDELIALCAGHVRPGEPIYIYRTTTTDHTEMVLWTENVEELLSNHKGTIRAHPGGGPEDLLLSLILTFNRMKADLAAALATQPATSQGKVENGAGKPETDADDAGKPATSQEGEGRIGGGVVFYNRGGYSVRPAGSPFEGTADGYTFIPLTDEQVAALAATPTPPTLSEDLREALERNIPVGTIDARTRDAIIVNVLRAALAQVKAS